MPEINEKQLAILVRKGATNREIEAALGHLLTADQKRIIDRARVIRKLRKKEGLSKTYPNGGKSGAERIREMRERERLIDCPPVEDIKRRNRLEADTPAWLRWYLENSYPFPFSDGHLELIANIEHAAKTGEGTATAQPRGEGKSAVSRGVSIKLIVTGIIRFPVLVGWKHGDAKDALTVWLRMLCDNPRFAADYPRICAPFIHSTHALALKNLVWSDTRAKIGAMVDTMGKMIILPDSLGAIAARSAQGDAKGLNAMMPDGTILRPDFLLIDDAQDVNGATNPTAVAATVDKLENVFMGMSGRQHRLSAAAACTVEADGDVSCHWLTRPGWTSNRISRIGVWPDGSTGGTWEAANGCPIKKLWDDWREIYLADGQKKANAFFRKNRKAMVGKMEVSWIHGYDHDLEVSAYDAAMHAWYNLGPDVFARGQQNNPLVKGVDVYHITPEIIMSRMSDRQAYDVPEWSELIIAATDINPSYAYSSVVYAFGRDRTAACLWYGLFEEPAFMTNESMSQTQQDQLKFSALWRVGEGMLSARVHGKYWIIDGGGAQSTVAKRFCYEWNRKHPEMICIPAYGRAGKTARVSARNETIRQKGRDGSWLLCRDRDQVYGWNEWILWHSDYWREIQQKAWTCETGAPGGATLPKGNHREYAEHLCRERLKGKGLIGEKMFFDFVKSPGRNDLSDATGMAFVLSDVHGIGTGGQIIKQKSQQQRSIRHVEI